MAQDNHGSTGSTFEDVPQMTEEEVLEAELDDLLSAWGGTEEDIEDEVLVEVSFRKVFRDVDDDLVYIEYEEAFGLISMANCVRLEDSISGFLKLDEELETYFNDGTDGEFEDEEEEYE